MKALWASQKSTWYQKQQQQTNQQTWERSCLWPVVAVVMQTEATISFLCAWHAVTHVFTQKHTKRHKHSLEDVRFDTPVWIPAVITFLVLLSQSLLGCPPHPVTLCILFILPTHIPCICHFLSPLRVWGRIWHSFSVLFVDIAIIPVV